MKKHKERRKTRNSSPTTLHLIGHILPPVLLHDNLTSEFIHCMYLQYLLYVSTKFIHCVYLQLNMLLITAFHKISSLWAHSMLYLSARSKVSGQMLQVIHIIAHLSRACVCSSQPSVFWTL